MSRFLSVLVVLLTATASRSFNAIPATSNRLRSHSVCSDPLLGLRRRSSAPFVIRGGDDTRDRRDGGRLMMQSSAIVTAPFKLFAGTVAGVFSLIMKEIKSLTFHQKTFFLATFVLGFFMGRLRPFWKRYTDVNDIPSSFFGNNAPVLRGRAVRVSDGDTIRFLHQPTRFHPAKLRKGEKASAVALPVRLCTIDTPETAKFGKTGMAFGVEAKEHLKSMLEDKVVYARLLQKDQYSRAVAEVYTTKFPFLQRFMDAEMLKEGLAEVYLGGGAVYGPLGKEEYLAIEEKAKKAKKGIWSQKNRETAAEYKRRTKE